MNVSRHVTSRRKENERTPQTSKRSYTQCTHTLRLTNRRDARTCKKRKQSIRITKMSLLREHDTDHKAVAAKHIVLPTYIGSRSTLNGKPSTRASIKIPK